MLAVLYFDIINGCIGGLGIIDPIWNDSKFHSYDFFLCNSF